MKQYFLILSMILLILAACTSTTPFPTEIPINTPIPPTETTTFTPALTSTATATATPGPWMASLPENVSSVELNGEDVLGLDAQGNTVMQFDLEANEWGKVYTDPFDPDIVDSCNARIAEAGGLDQNRLFYGSREFYKNWSTVFCGAEKISMKNVEDVEVSSVYVMYGQISTGEIFAHAVAWEGHDGEFHPLFKIFVDGAQPVNNGFKAFEFNSYNDFDEIISDWPFGTIVVVSSARQDRMDFKDLVSIDDWSDEQKKFGEGFLEGLGDREARI